jgi:hypothetical protein
MVNGLNLPGNEQRRETKEEATERPLQDRKERKRKRKRKRKRRKEKAR